MANYTKGKIAIPNVTGDIVINITAVAQAQENAFPSKFYETDDVTLYNGLGYKTGYRFNSKRQETNSGASSNDTVTGYLDISGAKKVIVSGVTAPGVTTGNRILYYDANHDVITDAPAIYGTNLPNGEFTKSATDLFRIPQNAKYIRFHVNTANCTGTPPALTVVLE